MKLIQAKILATDLLNRLKPHCQRIEIAGSIRRQCAEIKDVEIVCIPSVIEHRDLFGEITGYKNCKGFIDEIEKLEKVKGDAIGKYTQRILPGGIKADIFIANELNWGYIYAIRTGSSEFSRRVLAGGWVRAGYHGQEGMLTKDGKAIPIREEEDLFNIIGIPYVHPIDRS